MHWVDLKGKRKEGTQKKKKKNLEKKVEINAISRETWLTYLFG